MTLKSFHSNVENWNMTISYRGLSINFHSVSAPLLYTKLHIPWIVEQICWLPAASCAVWKLEQPQEMDPKYYVSIDIIKMTTF